MGHLGRRVAGHLRSNVVAYIALFFALTGTAFAASDVLLDEKNAVDSANLARGAVEKPDIGDGEVAQGKLAEGLKSQLDLDAEQPADGRYSATDTEFNGSASVTVSVDWVNGTPTGVSFASSNPACTYDAPGKAVKISPGAFVWNSHTQGGTLVAYVSWETSSLTVLDAGMVQRPGGACSLFQIPLSGQG